MLLLALCLFCAFEVVNMAEKDALNDQNCKNLKNSNIPSFEQESEISENLNIQSSEQRTEPDKSIENLSASQSNTQSSLINQIIDTGFWCGKAFQSKL
jgi:hypothetical protein